MIIVDFPFFECYLGLDLVVQISSSGQVASDTCVEPVPFSSIHDLLAEYSHGTYHFILPAA